MLSLICHFSLLHPLLLALSLSIYSLALPPSVSSLSHFSFYPPPLSNYSLTLSIYSFPLFILSFLFFIYSLSLSSYSLSLSLSLLIPLLYLYSLSLY